LQSKDAICTCVVQSSSQHRSPWLGLSQHPSHGQCAPSFKRIWSPIGRTDRFLALIQADRVSIMDRSHSSRTGRPHSAPSSKRVWSAIVLPRPQSIRNTRPHSSDLIAPRGTAPSFKWIWSTRLPPRPHSRLPISTRQAAPSIKQSGCLDTLAPSFNPFRSRPSAPTFKPLRSQVASPISGAPSFKRIFLRKSPQVLPREVAFFFDPIPWLYLGSFGFMFGSATSSVFLSQVVCQVGLCG
jgi:hypothetical protein